MLSAAMILCEDQLVELDALSEADDTKDVPVCSPEQPDETVCLM